MTAFDADRDRIEPDPLPVPAGAAPFVTVATSGPPDGLTFLGARETVGGWLLHCPCCCSGWVPLAPRGDGYEIELSIGCTRGCDPNEITWWHCWRTGTLPPETEPDERQRRYARGAVKNALAAALEGKNPLSAARDAGRFAAAAGYHPNALSVAFVAAANGKVDEHTLLNAIRVGAATPGRLPR
jgi:hypothetical protein